MPRDPWYKAGRQILEANFLAAGNPPRIDEPADILAYFTRLFHSGDLDAHNIEGHRKTGNFAEVAKLYSLIDDDSVPVVVATWRERTAEIEILLDNLRADKSRANFRALVPFQVNLRRHEIAKMTGLVAQLTENLGLLVYYGAYDAYLGVSGEAAETALVV